VSTRLSASQLQRVAVCPASAVLPRVDSVNAAAARGTALHSYLEAVPVVGRDEALASVPDEYRAACEALDLEALPVCAVRYAAEVAFALDPRTGAARELGRSMGRDYSGAKGHEIVGTADVVGLSEDGSTLAVLDYKTGRGADLAKAERNWQLRFLALAGCRTYGATSAHVALVHVHENGTAHYDSAVFDAFDLAVIAHDLARLANRVAFAERSVRAGEPPLATTGEHCKWCPCLPYCPAQTALVRTVAGEIDEWDRPVTPADAARAYERVKALKAALARVERNLYTYAAGTPIPLPNGLVLGQVETTREEVDGEIARRVLAELHGQDVADRACEWSTSKAAIERALRPVAASTEQKITHLKKSALAAIAAAGGITRNTTTSVREHAPDNRAAAQVAADMAALAASLE
jgi:RecB family exonuclease